MKKKGFTLVELLAVIIILAVIALIATPIVLNVVEKSRKSAFESSVYGIVETIELEAADKMIKGESLISEYNFPTEELEFQGEQPEGGIAKTDRKGKVSIAVHNGKWCAIKGYDEGTLTIKEYEERTCILKETEVYYYGYIDDGEYTVDLNGVIFEYTGTDTEVTIPESFSGEPYYLSIDEQTCISYLSGNGSSLTAEELRIMCYRTPLDIASKEYLKELGIISSKTGYIEYQNIKPNLDRCAALGNSTDEMEVEKEYFSSCDLKALYNMGYTIEHLYQLGVITADRYVVDKYEEIREINGTETFEYVLDKNECVSLINPEGTLSDEASIAGCYLEILNSDEETINGFISSGLITEANGYYQFKNIEFNKNKCISTFTELGMSSEEAIYGCSYDTLTDLGTTINMMYETGIVTAEREVGYFEEDEVVEQHYYEMNYEACKTFMKQENSELTDDEVLSQCTVIDGEMQTMDISESREEYLETFTQFTQMGILNKVKTVFAIKNVEIDEDGCKAYFILMGETEESALASCTAEDWNSDSISYKFLYEQGVITGEVMDINEENEVKIKENIIENKIINTIGVGAKAFWGNDITSAVFPLALETIGKDSFSGNSISGELDLSYLTKLTYVSGFYGNKITSIKLPDSIEAIGYRAFDWNSIIGELDLSNLTKLTYVSGFEANEITSVKLPSSLKMVGFFAFFGNQLTSIGLPNNVEKIGFCSFCENDISGELDLSNTKIKMIGKEAFMGNEITSVKLPNSLEVISNAVFRGNEISGELDLSNTKITAIGTFAFYENDITSIKLPNSVETIGEDAFGKYNSNEDYNDSNPNLTEIINPSGNVFNWSNITGSNTLAQNFVVGTITHQHGNIEVKAE